MPGGAPPLALPGCPASRPLQAFVGRRPLPRGEAPRSPVPTAPTMATGSRRTTYC